MADRVAVGLRCHSGWAVAVAVSGRPARPVIVDRQRIELLDESLPRMPYHAIVKGVSPREIIAQVEADAADKAFDALRGMRDAAAIGLVAAERRIPGDLDRILASHALLHAAEGDLYEQAIMGAAARAGLPVHVVDPKTTIRPELDDLRRVIGPPWQKDHKLAATAAFLALDAL